MAHTARNILTGAILAAFLAAGTAQALDLNRGEWLYINSDSGTNGEIWTTDGDTGNDQATGATITGTLNVSGLPGGSGGWSGSGNDNRYGVVTIADLTNPFNLTIAPSSGITYTYNNAASTAVSDLAGVHSVNLGGGTITYAGGDITITATETTLQSAARTNLYGLYAWSEDLIVKQGSGDIKLSGTLSLGTQLTVGNSGMGLTAGLFAINGSAESYSSVIVGTLTRSDLGSSASAYGSIYAVYASGDATIMPVAMPRCMAT